MYRELLYSALVFLAWPVEPRAEVTTGPTAAECEEARVISSQAPSENPARIRYEARLRLKACAAAERARLAGLAMNEATTPEQRLHALDTIQDSERQQEPAIRETKAQAEFMGLAFGVGVGFSYSFDDVVSQASIDGAGKIVAETRQRQLPRVILESHYYGLCKTASCNAGSFGVGPYFGIVAKSDKLISAFSAGVMFGWRDPVPENSQGFSIGVGALLDDEVKSLAKGFKAGEPPPSGETSVRYETKARWSGLLFFTRTF
jgi:hypothetical protein